MEISSDKKVIKELQIALSYYIKGIVVSSQSREWTYSIQRMTEHSLLKYTVMDIRKENFLELTDIIVKKNKFNLIFSNDKCKYAKEIKKIEVDVPFNQSSNNVYELIGDVKISI